ncbi:MAG: tripartite tricarboxylate transporter substrate binding protein [Betaproteobacteria bacterium]|nr:tripartite tricarboxylate transporter substrate binding protein [Betaproteobacteria bacterium]
MTAAFRYALALVFVILPATAVLAQAYPAKPVRMIIPFPPGGPTDLMGRMAADRLSKAWNVQVVPDNRGGAGGNIGTELCAKSPPDGYTICMLTVAQTISPSIYKKLGYDPLRDFAHVTLMAVLPSLLTTHPTLPVKNVRELAALAKSRPGQLTYASTGNGTSPHMLMEMFKHLAGLDMVHVPYKGQAPSVVDQLSGQVQLAFNTAVTVLPQVKAGKLKPIAVSTRERFPPMPELQTVEEGGVKGFDGSSWQSVVMPAGTPREIVAKVYQELAGMLKAAETRERFLAQGALASGIPPDEFLAFIKRELEKWARVAKAANVTVD